MFRKYYYVEGLTSLIGSNKKYLINYLGQVKDSMGNDVPISTDNEGHLTVIVDGFDGYKTYRIIDLMVIQYKSLKIPREDFCKIIGFVIDGDRTNVQAKNIGYRFLGGKLEVKYNPGFYYIPGYTCTAINRNGDLLNVKSNNVVNWYITTFNEKKNIKGGYRTYSTKGCNGKTTTLLRHRAVALVFMEYPDNCDLLVVNHKNGIPGNDYPDNLEWITRSLNNIHAYENNLKNQHKRVLVRHVLTGEITEYYSISQCSRELGYSTDETIRQRLYGSKFGTVFEDGYQIKLKSDERDWVIPDNPKEAVEQAQMRIRIKVRNCLDLTTKIYNSIIDASNETGVNNATIGYRLQKDDKSPLRGYQFAHLDDNEEWPTFTNQEYLKTLNPSNCSVDARNHLTGEKIRFDSINKTSKYFNKSVSELLKYGKQPLFPNGWQIKLADEIWEEHTDLEEALYKANKEIMARREDDGFIILANSSREMGEVLKLDPKMIRKMAYTRGEKNYHGYRFRLGISNEPWPTT